MSCAIKYTITYILPRISHLFDISLAVIELWLLGSLRRHFVFCLHFSCHPAYKHSGLSEGLSAGVRHGRMRVILTYGVAHFIKHSIRFRRPPGATNLRLELT